MLADRDRRSPQGRGGVDIMAILCPRIGYSPRACKRSLQVASKRFHRILAVFVRQVVDSGDRFRQVRSWGMAKMAG